MTKIRNIIFDFGGVIYNVRYENMTERLAELGMSEAAAFYSKDHQTNEMDLFEVGRIGADEFRDYLRRASGLEVDDVTLDGAINAMLLGLPKGHVDLLLGVKERYRTFLFSNTNEIHCRRFTEEINEQYGFDVLGTCFERTYMSHRIHMKKPAREGFRLIVEENGLMPEETLFVDDIAANLRGAREMGMATHHLTGDLVDLFDENFELRI